MAFRFAYRQGGTTVPVKEFPSGASKTWTRGEMANLESGLLDNGVAGDSAVVGIVNETISTNTTEGDLVEVVLALDDVVFECDYTGSIKTSLGDADIGTAFDYDATIDGINLDDTTGGMWVVIGYDNDRGVALVKLASGSRAAVVS